MAEDLDVIPWGAQDRFQAHFIVKIRGTISQQDFLARTTLRPEGHFASKKVGSVEWVGGQLADNLNADNDLKNLILKLPYDDAEILVEPTNSGIRIHGNWKSSYNFAITKELFSVYDKIASHVRIMLGSPPIKS